MSSVRATTNIAFATGSVAIVGLAGRFPGAAEADAYWRNLRDGVESVSQLSDAQLLASGVDPALLVDPAYVKSRALLDSVDKFDAAFFGFSPRDAATTDPQQRIMLELAWAALESAGCDPSRFDGSIGVYAGSSMNTYLLANLLSDRAALTDLLGEYQVGGYGTIIGNDKDYLATRISYKLDLRGPSVAVQSACSTSLVAVCQAVHSLLSGQCDMALAGGVSITFPQERGYLYQEGAIVSPDGHCRPFAADAAGTVFGSGGGLVVLRRLEDAVANRDPIRAVILGTGMSNDGALKVSYMAPSVDGQAEAIIRAHRMAGIDPSTITYVETHGTATPLGDPIEIAALTKAFHEGGATGRGTCLIGSSKSNFGHLAEASGIAGLIKTIHAIEHGQIPASLHYDAPNPRIDFDATPFRVAARLTDWRSPRKAGVSSFGVGGTNAHVVLEEAPAVPPPVAPTRPHQLLVVSAKSEPALDAACEQLATHIETHAGLDLADAAYTLQVGRREFDYRRAVAATSAPEAVQRLREGQGAQHAKPQSVAFLFPGQGSQHANMARGLYDTEESFRLDIDACAERLVPHLGLDLREIMFPPPDRKVDSARLLTETWLTQPALFTIEYALGMLWIEWGIVPDALMGHSVGEFVAATLAGVFTLDEALRIVAVRGRLMQALPAGGMLAVRLPEAEVRGMMGPDLSVAAINSPMLTVVSGPQEAIDAFDKRLEELGKPARKLHTSHAFHSSMMEPMLPAFRNEFEGIALKAPGIPIVSDVTGDWLTDDMATDPEYWISHVRESVRFAAAVTTLAQEEGRVLLEAGPGNVLTALSRQTLQGRGTIALSSLDHPNAETPDDFHIVSALGRLWQAGLRPDWTAFHNGAARRRIALPGYVFEQQRYWVDQPVVVRHGDYAKIGASNDGGSGLAQAHAPNEDAVTMKHIQPTSRVDHLAERIVEIVHDLSGLPVDAIDPNVSFLEMGFDSLFLTQASQAFGREFGVKVTFRELLDTASSATALAHHLDKNLPEGKFMPPPEQPEPAPQAVECLGSEIANAPQFSPLQDVPTYHAAPQPPQRSSAVETIIAQQLSVMQQQLAVLAAHGFPTPTNFPASSPIPALATLTEASTQSPPPSRVEAASPQPTVSAPPAPVKAHGPFRPIDRGETGGLNERQLAHLNDLIARYEARTSASKQYTAAHRDALADPRAVAGFKQLWKEIVYPIVGVRSEGSRVWDIDGNEYLDVTLGFGVNMFGHKPDFVMRAIEEQMKSGIEIGPQNPLAGEVAATICRLTGMERVTFCNTGSEAVMVSVRLARTVTGRDKVVYFSGDYHGTHDEVLLRAANKDGQLRTLPIAPGIPISAAEQTVILDYGAPESLDIIRSLAPELAAVLVEPVQSRNPDFQPREFLHELRKITAQSGVAMIFDEIITGFRCHPAGAQAFYGIKADLATYGKVIGGGMPFGVVAGSHEYMDALDGGSWTYGDASFPEVGVTFFAGTFVRHPLAMAAARSVLMHLTQQGPALQEALNERTAAFADELNRHFKQVGAPLHIPHFSSLFYLHFDPDVKWGSLLWFHLREKGVHIWEGRPCFLSTAHTDDDIAYLSWAFKASVAEMQEGGFLRGSSPTQLPPSMPPARPLLVDDAPPPRPSMFAPRAVAPVAVEPAAVAVEPAAVEPEPVAPEPEPVAAEPVAAEPVAVEPEPVAPVAVEPVAVEPEPVAAEPVAVAPEPVAAEPAAVEPEPVAAEPVAVEPEPVAAEPVVVEPEAEPIRAPLTETQREIWLATKMSDEATRAFDESVSLHLRGPLEIDLLVRAFDRLAARHEAFRTTFAADGSEQIIAAHGRLEPQFHDLSDLGMAEAGRALDEILAGEGSQRFDLERGPLFSVRVIKMDSLYHVVSLTAHHIVFDGWSLGVALEELAALYNAAVGNHAHSLDPAPLYSEFSAAQAQALKSAEAEETLRYWVEQIGGDPAVPQLPADRPRRAARSFAGSTQTLSIPGGLLMGLRQLGSSKGCTLLATTASAWSALMARLCGQSTLTIGVPTAGQQSAPNAQLIGHCVNVLPVKFHVDNGAAFTDYLVRTRNVLLDAFDHQNCTFGSLLNSLPVVREAGNPPLVSVTFNIDRRPSGLLFEGLHHEITTNPRQFYQFDLGINIVESDTELLIEANYDAEQFDGATIQRWLGHFAQILESIVANPSCRVGDLEILSRQDRSLLTGEWCGHATEFPRDRDLASLFEETVRQYPDKNAATLGDRKITYRQLNAYANQLARCLVERGAGPGRYVALMVDRSLELLISVIAIAKSGAAYMPVDPLQPSRRTLALLAQAGVSLVVTQDKHSANFTDAALHIIRVDTEWHLASGNPHENLNLTIEADSPAYALFTSGSTGTPKCVVLPHMAAVRLVRGCNYADLGPDQIYLMHSPTSFDVSTFEIWGPLLNGGRIVVAPAGDLTIQRIGELVAAHSVTTLWLTAGLFHAFIDTSPELLRPLKQLMAGGDVLSVPHVAKALSMLPGVRLINGYGPTESGTFTTTHDIQPEDIERVSIPIGRPINNTRVYILDDALRLVPVGVDGEIYIGGEGLALGYLADKELTERKFIDDPFAPNSYPGVVYRSGDRARWLPGGSIEFRGRVDTQVKIRGFRVEAGEIEQAILAFPGIRDAIVVPRDLPNADKQLVAYVVLDRPGAVLDAAALRGTLAQALPAYMIPAAIMALEAIPLTSTGKPDRKRLPAPNIESVRSGTAQAHARDKVESKLVSMWERLFDHAVDLRDDFWTLGGHSLLAVRLFVDIEKEFGKRLPLQTLFTAPTIEKLATVIRGPVAHDAWATLVPIQPNGVRPPLYCMHHAHGVIAGYRDLARHIGSDQQVIGIQARGLDGESAPQTKVEEIAESYITDILAANPTGPYLLCGLSFGGILAFEMARQLHARGKHVAFLGLIDTYAPDYFRQHAAKEQQAPIVVKALDQINAVRNIEPAFRLSYVTNRIRHGFKRLQALATNQVAPVGADRDGYLPEALLAIQHASELAMKDYYPGRYDGEIVLFRAQERLDWKFNDPLMAWGGLADNVRVIECPGNHYTINQDPCAHMLARNMRAEIDKALESL